MNRFLIVITLLIPLFSCKQALETTKNGQENKRVTQTVQYAGLYFREFELRFFDEVLNIDSLLLTVKTSDIRKKLSPLSDKIAISYQTEDSTKLAVILFHPLRLQFVASTGKNNTIAMAWKDDNTTLFFNFYKWKKIKNNDVPQNLGLYSFSLDPNTIIPLKITNGAKIDSWLPIGLLVVNYLDTYYLIDIKTGKPVHTLKGYHDLCFSPDGKWCFFYKYRSTINTLGLNVKVPELYLSRFDGKEEKRIADYSYEPRNAEWSPNSKTIAFDLQSQKWGNIRCIAYYNLSDGKANFEIEEDFFEGVASIQEPHYSPSGNLICLYKRLDRGEHDIEWGWQKIILRDLVYKKDIVISSGVFYLKRPELSTASGAFWSWFTNDILCFCTVDWVRLYHVPSNTTTEFMGSPFYIWTRK